MAAVLFGGLAFSQSVFAGDPEPEPGSGGCSPGYWKANAVTDNPANAWTIENPTDTLAFAGFDPQSVDPATTLLETLQLSGGEGAEGMERNLLRHCVAGKLNDENPNIGFAIEAGDVISMCNVVMATGDKDTMENFKDQLDDFNNLDCPIDMKGVPING